MQKARSIQIATCIDLRLNLLQSCTPASIHKARLKYQSISYLVRKPVQASTWQPGTGTKTRNLKYIKFTIFIFKKSENLLKFYPVYLEVLLDVVPGRIQYRWRVRVLKDYLSQNAQPINKQVSIQASKLATIHTPCLPTKSPCPCHPSPR